METKDSELNFGKLSESTAQATRDESYPLAATLATMAYNTTSDPSDEKARMARDVGNAYRQLRRS